MTRLSKERLEEIRSGKHFMYSDLKIGEIVDLLAHIDALEGELLKTNKILDIAFDNLRTSSHNIEVLTKRLEMTKQLPPMANMLTKLAEFEVTEDFISRVISGLRGDEQFKALFQAVIDQLKEELEND